jgi:hypothetical protein
MGQMQFFTTAQVAEMRDRTASRRYSPAAEEFRRDHARHREWGLRRRHADRLRRARGASRGLRTAPLSGDPARLPEASAPRCTRAPVIAAPAPASVAAAMPAPAAEVSAPAVAPASVVRAPAAEVSAPAANPGRYEAASVDGVGRVRKFSMSGGCVAASTRSGVLVGASARCGPQHAMRERPTRRIDSDRGGRRCLPDLESAGLAKVCECPPSAFDAIYFAIMSMVSGELCQEPEMIHDYSLRSIGWVADR